MKIQPKPIFNKYIEDPSFTDSYFREDLIISKDSILNINYKEEYYRFSVERLTIRDFDRKAYRQFKHIKTFSNQSFRIVLFLKGSNSIYINNEITKLPEHALLLFGPGEQISITPKRPTECQILEFYFNLLNKENEPLMIDILDYLSIITGENLEEKQSYYSLSPLLKNELQLKFEALMQELKINWMNHDEDFHFDIMGKQIDSSQFSANLIILNVFSSLLKDVINKEKKQLIPENIETAARYMRENYKTQISIAVLSEMASLSRHYFQAAFKKHYSVSPIVFLNRIRIRQAMKMLETTKLSAKTIAEHVGIENPFYFSKLFKRYVEMTPTEFRKYKINSN